MSLKAKIAGGSQMFQFGSSDTIRIGPRNVEAVKQELKALIDPYHCRRYRWFEWPDN